MERLRRFPTPTPASRLALAALLVALLVAVASPVRAQGEAAPLWEYARLSLGSDPAAASGALVGGWVTPEASLFVPGGAQPLAERLAARAVRDTEDALIVLLGEIGERGWELVAVVEADGRREFFFKRPRSGA